MNKLKKFLQEKFKNNQFNWKELPTWLFSTETRASTHRTFIYSLLIIGCYQIGANLAVFMTPNPAQVKSQPIDRMDSHQLSLATVNYEHIRAQNLFKIETLVDDEVQGHEGVCETASQETQLPITLLDTIVLQDRVKSVASVQMKNQQERKKLRIGDHIEQMAKIENINRLEMIIKNLQTGLCEKVVNKEKLLSRQSKINVMSDDQAKKFQAEKDSFDGIVNDGNQFKIPRKILNESLANPASILTQAKAIPVNNPDGSMSFKITEIEPGGVFDKLGIKNDDLITHINGRPISNMSEVMNMFMSLSSLSSLKLGMKRSGSDVSQSYEFVDK